MRGAAAAKSLVIATACSVFMIPDANPQDCRGFLKAARLAIGGEVMALRRIEHETSDRLKGLDSRPFEVLRDEARKTTAVIANPGALKLEELLKGCRNWTVPVRKICAEAGQSLAEILGKYAATPKPDYDKSAYAAAIGECERLMDVTPLASTIRGTE